jgi:hydroxyacylglutathione hydrolase
MENFTYLVGSRSSREVVIVDPAWDIDVLLKRIDEAGFTLKGALVTHYHPDHCGGSFGQNSVEGVAELLAAGKENTNEEFDYLDHACVARSGGR